MNELRALILAAAMAAACQPPATREIPVPDLAAMATNEAVRVLAARADLEKAPRSGEAWGRYGMQLSAFDFDAAAVECYRRARELDPQNPRWPYFLARALAADRPAESIDLLAETVKLTGSEPEAPRFYLAKALAEAGQWAEAKKHAEALNDFIPGMLLRAQAALAHQSLDEAAKLAERCAVDPRTARAAHALLAAIYARRGDSAAAAEVSRKAGLLPADQLVFDAFEAEVAALRSDPQGLASRAHALLAGRKLSEAEQVIDRLTREHPGFAEGFLVLGRLRLLQTNYTAADAALEKHLQMDPKSIQGHFQLGMTRLNSGRFELAAASFETATELKQDFGAAWFNRGFALGRAGRLAEAASAFREALRYSPEHLETYLLLADLEARAGRREEALKLLHRAEEIAPGNRRVQSFKQKLASGEAVR